MGSQEDFTPSVELAQLLDGALGGSRPAVEKGWIHSRFQVGLTGVRVSPKLYIAVGISGSIQHIAGVMGAKTIVAINKDPEANIFKEAHYGVVGDYKQVLPAIQRMPERTSGKQVKEAYMAKEDFIKIVGPERVFDDEETLRVYANDESGATSMPFSVVKAHSTEEVQQIVKLANERASPSSR